MSSAHTAHTCAQHTQPAQHAGSEREGKEEATQPLCRVRGSDTHSARRVQRVSVLPPTQQLPQPAAVGTGFVPHHPHGAL